MTYRFKKCPAEILDFVIDFSLLEGDSIIDAQWSIPPDLQIEETSSTSTTATAFLSDGTLWSINKCSALISTALGRVINIKFEIEIVDRHELESRRMLYNHEERMTFYIHPRDTSDDLSEWSDMSTMNPRRMKVIPEDYIRTQGV